MTEQNTNGQLAAVLDEISSSRGLTLAGLADETRRRGHDFTPAGILRGEGGFGTAVDAVLGLDDAERGRIVGGVLAAWNGDRAAPDAPDEPPRAPGLGHYGPGPNPREDGGPTCCVSHPAAGGPCGEPAAMEVWHLSFCEAHGNEAEAAALAELWENARRGMLAAIEGGREMWRRNAALLLILRGAFDEAQEHEQEHDGRHDAAMQEVYGDVSGAHTDPETARWNGDDFADSPTQWFHDARVAVCKAMREAIEGGLTHAKYLEPVREYLTVQEVLAVRAELAEADARRPA